MPIFKVVNPLGYWDGAHKHKPGTLVEIGPEDYKTLLSLDMEPMDEQGRKDLKRLKVEWAPKGPDGKPINFIPVWAEQKSGTLNPNDAHDLRQLTPRGAKVVRAAEEVETVKVVKPETAGL